MVGPRRGRLTSFGALRQLRNSWYVSLVVSHERFGIWFTDHMTTVVAVIMRVTGKVVVCH